MFSNLVGAMMKTDELQYGLETPRSISDTMEVKEVPVQLKKRFDVLIAHPWHTRNFASYFLVNRSGVVQHLPGGRNSPSTMKATVEAA